MQFCRSSTLKKPEIKKLLVADEHLDAGTDVGVKKHVYPKRLSAANRSKSALDVTLAKIGEIKRSRSDSNGCVIFDGGNDVR